MDTTHESLYVKCTHSIDDNSNVRFIIKFKVAPDHGTFTYLAAAPPDRRASYSGSSLPFPSPLFAFQNSDARGEARVDADGQSTPIMIKLPNSFYGGLGTVLIPPTLYIKYKLSGREQEEAIKLTEPVGYRGLTYDNERTTSMFYGRRLPVRSQEQILNDSAYSKTRQDSFWGLKPPA